MSDVVVVYDFTSMALTRCCNAIARIICTQKWNKIKQKPTMALDWHVNGLHGHDDTWNVSFNRWD
jgi:hypothetical protein